MMIPASNTTPLPQPGTIIVVEDEVGIQRLVRHDLEPFGYRVLLTVQAEDVFKLLHTCQPDLVVLGIKPGNNFGFELCQRIRSISAVPIIIVSSLGQPADKVHGFELGADDYVTHPYDPTELRARIKALLRRVQSQTAEHQPVFRHGALTIDFDQHLVRLHETEVQLSCTEYRLLELLALNAGRTLLADAMLVKVWGPQYIGDYASLHLYISRLRRKLGEDAHNPSLIVTKPGIGYMLTSLTNSTEQ